MVIIASRLRRPRRARRETSTVSNRSFGAPRLCLESRRKTLSKGALEEIPLYRTGKASKAEMTSNSPDVERGITFESSQPNISNSTKASSAGIAGQEFAPWRLNFSADGLAERSQNDPNAQLPCFPGNSPICAICAEGFPEGQLIRYLPCCHKYHAKCIDHWLVNVSGSCPLWYVWSVDVFTTLKKQSNYIILAAWIYVVIRV